MPLVARCIDDCTNYSWSFFLKQKSETKDIMIALNKELKQTYDIEVKTIQCDNPGGKMHCREVASRKG
jgi:methionine synthase II (cobalamin-independent)